MLSGDLGVAERSEITETIQACCRECMMSELQTRRALSGLGQTDVKDPTRQALAVFLKDPPQQQEAGHRLFQTARLGAPGEWLLPFARQTRERPSSVLRMPSMLICHLGRSGHCPHPPGRAGNLRTALQISRGSHRHLQVTPAWSLRPGPRTSLPPS